MFVTEYHWGVLIAQGPDRDLLYEKVKFSTFGLLHLGKLNYFFDIFLVYELAYPRDQIVLGLVSFFFY